MEERLVTFPSGTIVAQYVNDGNRFIGVAVGEHLRDRLSEHDRDLFDRLSLYHAIYLVLGYFSDWSDESIFTQPDPPFPRYIVASTKNVTKVDLAEEMALLRLYNTDVSGNTRSGLGVRARIFGSFGSQQQELLTLVRHFQHYMSGGDLNNRPGDLRLSDDDAERFYTELREVLPR